MSKQKHQLRYACNLEVESVKTDEEKLIAYAYYEDMLNAIGETNERAFTKRRRIMKRKLERRLKRKLERRLKRKLERRCK